MSDIWHIHDQENDNVHSFSNRSDAEEKLEMGRELNLNPELYPPGETPPGYKAEPDESETEPCGVCGDPVDPDRADTGPVGEAIHPKCNPGKAEPETPDPDTEAVEPEVVDHSPDPEPETGEPESPTLGVDICAHCGDAIEDGFCPACEGDTDTTESDAVQKTGQEAVEAIDELGEELGTDPLSILPSHMVDRIQGQPAINKRGFAMIAERYGISVTADIVTFPWDNPENRCVAKATAVTDDGKEYTGYGTACAEDGDMSDQIVELAETRSLKRAVSWASGVGIVGYQELTQELQE